MGWILNYATGPDALDPLSHTCRPSIAKNLVTFIREGQVYSRAGRKAKGSGCKGNKGSGCKGSDSGCGG